MYKLIYSPKFYAGTIEFKDKKSLEEFINSDECGEVHRIYKKDGSFLGQLLGLSQIGEYDGNKIWKVISFK